jgi:hypothetical protein
MLRAEVEEHVAASGAVHLRRAWGRAVEMEEKVAEQGSVILKQKEELAGMQRRADALTRVFTWSTDSEWSKGVSDPYTFTGGVVGRCYNQLNDEDDEEDETHLMGFILKQGPTCTMHFKCSILDKNDKVLRVVSEPQRCDFRKPPTRTARPGRGRGTAFNLTDADKAGAVRADGSIKLRMVVHLYLPE